MKNMKNILKYALAAGIAAVMLASCDLDLVPTTSIAYTPGESPMLTATDVTEFTNGVLSSYRGLYYGVYSQTSEVMCDGFNAVVDYGNNYGSEHRMDDSFSADNYDTRDLWSGNYGSIKNYNIAIENADGVADNLKAAARTMKGYAFFGRASSYLTLARHFGKAYGPSASTDLCVPLVLKYNQVEKPARATVAEVYAAIKEDLDSAAVILANAKGAVRSQKPTIDAVNALYARYYIDTKNYAQAAAYAEKVINSAAGYTLSSSADEMVEEWINDNGKEPILQMFASMAEGTGGNTIFTQISNDDKEGQYYASYYIPSANLMDTYEEGDLRLSTWYDPTEMRPLRAASTFHRDGFYVFIKYYDNPALRSGQVPTGAHARKPLLISEMYLIAAEAYAQEGNAGQAAVYLNALQTARGASATAGTLANVKTEWFKETVGEGLRYSCLKRWGDPIPARRPQAIAQQAGVLMYLAGNPVYYDRPAVPATDHRMCYPVPTYEMQVNPNLVQNPGYTTATE